MSSTLLFYVLSMGCLSYLFFPLSLGSFSCKHDSETIVCYTLPISLLKAQSSSFENRHNTTICRIQLLMPPMRN